MDTSLERPSLKWSNQFRVAASDGALQGDRITLPQSALEALLAAAPIVSVQSENFQNPHTTFDPYNPHTFAAEAEARNQLADRQQQLPHPLTFRLVNPHNNRVAYCGVREFSAEENEVGLSTVLRDALGIESTLSSPPDPSLADDGANRETEASGALRITIHAKQLPKGTYVRLRPLEAGYDPEDWKSLLERYLRDNFTTLTNGEILTVKTRRNESFQFLVDKLEPAGDAICIIDTDLEVDIEALNEEQARETLKRKLAKSQNHEDGTTAGSSYGGDISIGKESTGQVVQGEYVDYKLQLSDSDRKVISFELEIGQDHAEVDLLVSVLSATQRARPRNDEHIWGDFSSGPLKRIRLDKMDPDLEKAEAILVSVYAYQDKDTPSSIPIPFVLRSELNVPEANDLEVDQSHDLQPGEIICKNCQQSVPEHTLHLHEAFCYRNNISCPKCHQVFLRSSPSWKSHWHCPLDLAYGDTECGHRKHNDIYHPEDPLLCPNCDFQALSLPTLAKHRTSNCPGKEILCQFCHLLVPQQGPEDAAFTDPEVLLSGLTPHELTDGGRTTECHLCSKIVRLRDLKTHLMLHDRDRLARPKPRMCRNAVCGRTIKNSDFEASQQRLGLCAECFGPFYVASYDPEGKALKRRIERRLLQQLMAGCGKTWCHNSEFCRTGRKNTTGEDRASTAKTALTLVKPLLDAIETDSPFFFCVDELSQMRRDLSRSMAEMGEYEAEWWAQGLNETRGGGREPAAEQARRAREWLASRAPKIGEVVR